MSHYAIALKYNFNPDSAAGEITEYFVPFSIDELLSFELNQFTEKAIKKLRNSTRYPLDSFVERNSLEELDHIVLLKDDEIQEIESQKLREHNSYEETYGFSLWDLLSDANLTFYASQNYMENIENVNRLAVATVNSQYELLTLKIQISLLLHFEYEEYAETPDFLHENPRQGVSIDNIYDIIDFYSVVNQASDEHPITPDFIEHWMYDEETTNFDFYEVGFLIRDICALGQINNNPETSFVQRRNNWIAINTLSKQLLKKLWKPFNRAYYYHRVIKVVLRNDKYTYMRKDLYSLVKFIDEKAGFIEPSVSTKSRVIDAVSSFQEHASAICSGNYLQMVYWDSFSSYFGSKSATSKIRKRYSGEAYGCFALLFTDSDKHYFSISGMTEELKPRAGILAEPVKYIMEHILNKVPAPDIFAHNYTFNFAYIHHTLDVRRYTEIVRDKTDYINKPGPYLSKGFETYNIDYSKNPSELYDYTYSCCERKMLAYSGYDHAMKIFSRWAPCWKCCPAILDAPNVEVYAFTTLAEFCDKKLPTDMTLKQYKVERNLSYAVHKI